MVVSLLALLDHVKRMRLSISGEILVERALLGLSRHVVRRLQGLLLLRRLVQDLVPRRRVAQIDGIVVVEPRLVLLRRDFLQHGDVPVVDLRRLAVVLEAHGQLLAGLHAVGPVVCVVVRVGGQLDDEHVRVVRTAVVTGFHRQALPVMVVGGADPC